MRGKREALALSYEQVVKAVQGDETAISAVLRVSEESFCSRALRPTVSREGKTVFWEDLEAERADDLPGTARDAEF